MAMEEEPRTAVLALHKCWSGEFGVKLKVNVKGSGWKCPFHTGVAALR